MRERTLTQLIRIARALLDQCRRAHAAAQATSASLRAREEATREQRSVVLSGAAGLRAQAVAECTMALDRREARLREERGVAAQREEETRKRLEAALKETRILERLFELRDRRQREREVRAATARVDDMARVIRWRRREEMVDEADVG